MQLQHEIKLYFDMAMIQSNISVNTRHTFDLDNKYTTNIKYTDRQNKTQKP